ncbi:glycine zipper 2TM domain-containing protein [Novosphingobium sp.]|uniref:glycine zipper 2TM domain-containing protein n=1 Tax=Novosphingobium sp. TaxID=1874826 RepID=UPI002732EFCA|nr:glycine zipper 2TM domain-containing protein [Novosphingobium sp.]MDP3906252.1 glycine zipper 2TM domain-containing protein [Novosphingobium sp.]
MPVAHSLHPLAAAAVLAGSLALAAPALAQSMPGAAVDAQGRVFGNAVPAEQMPAMPPMVSHPVVQPLPAGALRHAVPGAPMAHPGAYHAPAQAPGYDPAAWDRARGDWLAECRRRMGGSRSTTAGAVVGGLFGGLLGNRVAGRGNRTVGTIAGAAVGAVAGGAIGASADRNRARDYCEAYLEDSLAGYYGQGQAGYGHGYQQAGYGPAHYGYAMQPVMMVPVMHHAAPPKARECVETTVIEEWVPVKTRKRTIAPRPDKRVKIVPDKRVRTY